MDIVLNGMMVWLNFSVALGGFLWIKKSDA